MNTLFFVASKYISLAFRVEIWVLVLFGALLYAAWSGRIGMARYLSLAIFTIFIVLGFFPVGDHAVAALERGYPPVSVVDEPDGIIVLGGAEDRLRTQIWDQFQINDAGERLTAAAALSRRFPQAKVVFSGGLGTIRNPADVDEDRFNAYVREFFVALGVDEGAVVVEGRSRTTVENAQFSYALVQPKAGERWLLVTSAFHMSRALRTFERAGWTGLVPYPVDYRSYAGAGRVKWQLLANLGLLNLALRERVGRAFHDLASR